MARPIVLSNGEMHVGLNEYSQVADFYYPYVGGENHVADRQLHHKVGIWADGRFSWTDDGTWEVSQSYVEHSLIGVSRLENLQLGLILEYTDVVDSEQSAFVRNIHVINLHDTRRDVRLFMHQLFVISNSHTSDTAQYVPEDNVVIHYKGLRTFVIGGMNDSKPFDQYVVGLNGIEGHEGSYRDAEDGELSNNTVEHGRVDSVIRFCIVLDPHDSKRIQYWVAGGKSMREALTIHRKILADGVLHRILLTDQYWHDWLTPARKAANRLPQEYRSPFLKSIMIIKSQLDKRGAVIASTDTTMLNYSRDSYAYCWPRDGALVIWPLIRMGYVDEPLHFFMFCRRVLTSGGYLMHKYQPDGALGSSWHPYVHGDKSAPPIQEDESAIVLFLFAQYHLVHQDQKILREFYPTLVAPIANFISSYISDDGLPQPSYDLWEEVFQTSTYTVMTVYGALEAAANLADDIGNTEDAVRWRTVAENIQRAATELLVVDGRLVKGLRLDRSQDSTLDSSSGFGGYMFGLFEPDSDIVQNTYTAIDERLRSGNGIARYENDNYHRSSESGVGNPWFITTLWLSQFLYETKQYNKAKEQLNWVLSYMLPTGVLAEQINPVSFAPLSVAPLTWSHAELVNTLLDTIQTKEQQS